MKTRIFRNSCNSSNEVYISRPYKSNLLEWFPLGIKRVKKIRSVPPYTKKLDPSLCSGDSPIVPPYEICTSDCTRLVHWKVVESLCSVTCGIGKFLHISLYISCSNSIKTNLRTLSIIHGEVF